MQKCAHIRILIAVTQRCLSSHSISWWERSQHSLYIQSSFQTAKVNQWKLISWSFLKSNFQIIFTIKKTFSLVLYNELLHTRTDVGRYNQSWDLHINLSSHLYHVHWGGLSISLHILFYIDCPFSALCSLSSVLSFLFPERTNMNQSLHLKSSQPILMFMSSASNITTR